jgi:hypothetical protein
MPQLPFGIWHVPFWSLACALFPKVVLVVDGRSQMILVPARQRFYPDSLWECQRHDFVLRCLISSGADLPDAGPVVEPSVGTLQDDGSARARGGSMPSGPAADRPRTRTGVHRELENDVLPVGPGLQPVPLRPCHDRADHRRARTRRVAAQEQPVLPPDGLIPQPSLRHVVVDRRPIVFCVTAQRLPLVQSIRHCLCQRRLGQQPRRESIQLASESL